MFCTKCGKQLEEGTAFCPNCGTAQNSAEIPAPDIACQQLESTAVSKKGKKKGLLFAILAIVLVGVCIAVFWGTRGDEVAGKWHDLDNPTVYMNLKKDHTGEMVSGEWAVKFTWDYNKASRMMSYDFSGLNISGTMRYDPDTDTLSRSDLTMVRVTK